MKLETGALYIVQDIREYYPDEDGTTSSTKRFDSVYTTYDEAFARARDLAKTVYEDMLSSHEDHKHLKEPREVGADYIEFDYDAEGSELSNVAGGYRCSWYPDDEDKDEYETFSAVVYQFVK